MLEKIFAEIEGSEKEAVETLSELIALPSVSPSDGGSGEGKRAEYLTEKLRELEADDIEEYDCEDELGNVRPNLVARIKGQTEQRLWIISHTDVVPAGDLSLWDSDPFKASVRDGRIFGRGANDNGTSLVASIYAARAFKKLKIAPERELCLCFAADEEKGSLCGIRHLIKQNLFKKDDLVLVPDMTSPDGDLIEIAEKSVFWIEFTVKGKQTHASQPQLGANAVRAANELSVMLDRSLHEAFPEENNIFCEPRTSTFEPTKRLANVKAVNIIPGLETFAFDCRVLPGISKNDLEQVIKYETEKTEHKHGVSVSYRYLQENPAAPATAQDAEIVTMLCEAVEKVLRVKPRTLGVGGNTCAAFLRQAGIPAAVWGMGDEVAHMPNEYAKISDLTDSAKVFAYLAQA